MDKLTVLQVGVASSLKAGSKSLLVPNPSSGIYIDLTSGRSEQLEAEIVLAVRDSGGGGVVGEDADGEGQWPWPWW